MPSATTAMSISSANADERGRERPPPRVGVDTARQADVELDDLRVDQQDVAKTGEARSRVVDRHACAAFADALERLGEAVVLLHRLVLGDLDDHPRGIDGVEELEHAVGLRRPIRRVDRHISVCRDGRQVGERGAIARELQLGAHPDRVGLGEPLGDGPWSPAVAEPRERFHPDHPMSVELDDGLIHHRASFPLQHAVDAVDLGEPLARLDLLSLELLRQIPHEAGHHLRRDAQLPAGGAHDRAEDLGRSGPLHEVADGAALEHPHDRSPVVHGAVSEHARLRQEVPELLRDAEPSARRHPDVDERDIRLHGFGHRDRLVRVASRADELERVIGLHEVGQGRSQDSLVVRDQHADGWPLHGRTVAAGSVPGNGAVA